MRSPLSPMASIDADVVVIGAGVSGIRCARELVAAGQHTVVVEARNRVGGRVLSVPTVDDDSATGREDGRDGPIELGAQTVHGAPDPFWELLGAQPGPPHSPAVPRVRVRGRSQPLWALARTEPPWMVEAAIWQGGGTSPTTTLTDLIAAGTTDPGTAAVAAEWLGQSWADDPARVSVGEARNARRPPSPGGPLTVHGGLGPAVARLAAGLDVRTNWPVRAVEVDPDGVVVRSDHRSLQARAVVFTGPPATVSAVDLPAMPDQQRRAAAGLVAGDAVCVAVRRDTPNGSDELLFDADGLLGFVRGCAGSNWLSLVSKGPGADRLRQLLDEPFALGRELNAALGGSAAVVDVVVADWGRDPFSLGAFSVPVPDADRLSACWRQPVAGRIVIAGEACADGGGRSFLQNADASGQRAAEEVTAMLMGSAAAQNRTPA